MANTAFSRATLPIVVFAAIAMCIPGHVLAGSGKHKKIKITNCMGTKIYAESFNGDDGTCGTNAGFGGASHSSTNVKGTGDDITGSVRCHGKSKKRCFITVRSDPKEGAACDKIKLDQGKHILVYRYRDQGSDQSGWGQTKDMDATCDCSRVSSHVLDKVPGCGKAQWIDLR